MLVHVRTGYAAAPPIGVLLGGRLAGSVPPRPWHPCFWALAGLLLSVLLLLCLPQTSVLAASQDPFFWVD